MARDCERCGGGGYTYEVSPHDYFDLEQKKCQECDGTGKVDTCRNCRSTFPACNLIDAICEDCFDEVNYGAATS